MDYTKGSTQNYQEIVKSMRDDMVTLILDSIEKNPTEWESGWTAIDATTPINGRTNRAYNGFNSLYLYLLAKKRGYKDSRWVTFNQAKELGASVKKGEKSSPVLFYQLYDKNTKKEFNSLTVRDMTDEEKKQYMQDNVRRVLKYSTVFNAEQCDRFPERTDELPTMTEEERTRQNVMIEQIINNSVAPIYYDGGNRAYYSPGSDSIHLPKIDAFHTMQDFYATALHEIAHSTGHESRLNRFGAYGSEDSYAVEELRAELASVFMQRELGITLEGRHFENHTAYLNSWLNAVRNDKRLFFDAVRDAEKISDYVAEHYLHAERGAELDARANVASDEKTQEEIPIFDLDAVFSEQVDAVLSGADTTSTHIKVCNTPKILRDVGLPNLPILMTAKHMKSVTQDSGTESMNYHGLDAKIVKRLPEQLADPVMIMDSLTRDDSVVVLTELADKKDNPIISAIKIDGFGHQDGKIISANILTSVYGKDDFESFLKRNIDAESILFWSKEKSQALSVNLGIQFPDVMATLDSDTIIRKAKAFVNTSAEKNQGNTFKPAEKPTTQTATQENNGEHKEELGLRSNYEIDFRLNYSNEMLLSNELKKLGYTVDKEAFRRNQERDALESGNGSGIWIDEIAYNGPDGKRLEGYYGKRFDGIMLESMNITGFNALNLSQSEVNEVAGIIRDFEVSVTVTRLDNAVAEQSSDVTKESEKGEHKKEISREEYELKALNIIINQQGKGVGEYITFEGSNYLINSGDLAVRYGGKVENGQIIITPELKSAFTDLQAKYQSDQSAKTADQKLEQTLGEELAGKATWLKIELPKDAIGGKFGNNTLIRMPEGEYAHFGLFVDSKYLKKNTEEKWTLTVGDKHNYSITNDGRRVELNGKELQDVLSGKELGRTPERYAASKKNKAALDRLAQNIPAELKALPCWGVYFTTPPKDPKKTKRDKVILSPTDGHWAKANEPSAWTDFDTAMKYALATDKEGLSLLLTKESRASGITCIDLDECIDAEGKYNGIASKLTEELKGTYTERSVSGNGLHIFVKDDVLKDGKYKSAVETPNGDLEVYDNAHIISLTGDMVSKTNEITRCPTATTLFLREQLGERQVANAASSAPKNANRGEYRSGTDNEVIERIRKSKRGAEFDAIYSGKGYTGNKSVDDMKLANILAFFTNCDEAQCLRIMRDSGSYRPDKSDDYYMHTIGKAVDTLFARPMQGATAGAEASKNPNGRGKD